jgi:hypothetical protein
VSLRAKLALAPLDVSQAQALFTNLSRALKPLPPLDDKSAVREKSLRGTALNESSGSLMVSIDGDKFNLYHRMINLYSQKLSLQLCRELNLLPL